MKRQLALMAALSLACGIPVVYSGFPSAGFSAEAQTRKATGTVTDPNGEPLIGASVVLKGVNRGG